MAVNGDIAGQDLERVPDGKVEPSAAQKRTKVWKHPERERLEALLRHGKSAEWIALWLEDEFELEDADGNPHPNKRVHEKLHLDPETIESYRREYLSDFAPGVDMLTSELEDAIGRRFPAPKSPVFEIEVVEAGVRAAEINLARGLEADEELEMLQPTTLQAQAQLIDAASASVEIKGQLGMPGYEPPPEHVVVDQTTRSMSVELQGRVDPATGEVVATEPGKLEVLRQLMKLPPERASQVLATAKQTDAAQDGEREEATPQAPAVVDSIATEIPVDEELDGGEGQRAGGSGGGSEDPSGGGQGSDPA